jgi:hypothetical protein
MNRRIQASALALIASLSPGIALAQQSAGCAELQQAAASGMAARMAADERDIRPPQSVTSLSCLDRFFDGIGFNVLTDGIDPMAMLSSAGQKLMAQACQVALSAWRSQVGSIQCGLTVSGFNLGFGGLGGGNYCPQIRLGGNGAAIGSATLGGGTGYNGYYVNGQPMTPTGYPVQRR